MKGVFFARFQPFEGLSPQGTAWHLSGLAEAFPQLDVSLPNIAKLLPGMQKPLRQMDTCTSM